MKGLGGLFERQALASMPKWCWARKVPDPPTRPMRCRCGGQITPKCSKCGAGHGHPATFTRRNLWDLEVRWTVADPLDLPGRLDRFELLAECKSTDGKRPLPFSVIREDQAKALRLAAEHGSFAGVLWEARLPSPICTWISIEAWLDLQSWVGRRSLPLSVAIDHGIVVAVDAGRGRTHTYYQMGRLLRSLESTPLADVPQAETKRKLLFSDSD